ncbi:rhodanese-like domain-containing protein [Bacteroidota bacterium]
MRNTLLEKCAKILFVIVLLGIISCNSIEKQKKETVPVQSLDINELVGEESRLLLDYLNELGDYVNSRSFPSLIKVSSVYEGLGENQLIIDIRTPELFSKGHIKNAVRINFEDIPEYFETKIVPFQYDKIIIVSEGGQTSSYTVCLLRLMGYGNVYSMRWGMSGWNMDFAKDGWNKAISSKYLDKLDKKIYDKDAPKKLPELKTGKTTGEEILMSRVHKLFSEGLGSAHITADEVFAAIPDFYIMNYIRRDKYETGHIPGAIRYKPEATLGIVTEMSTINPDKKSIVYCGTGHNSGFITAYLRLFGYNSLTLIYGNNSFMYDKMIAEKSSLSWLVFSKSNVEDYPYVKD